MSQHYLTIREMCDKYNVTARTLRFYEDRELLSPIREGQKRLYTKREQARLKLILRGKTFGFTLDDMHKILELYYVGDQQQTQVRHVHELGLLRLKDLEAEAVALQGTIADLNQALSESAAWLETVKTPKIDNQTG
ncbi:MAG: MerR family transcriptional regulator [Rhodobacteraceae bacterium]|nr:MAG: MerR family transcriptional regulator [Paracoccaceae bacterium]